MPWTNEIALTHPRQGLAAATCDATAPASGYRIYAVGGDDGTGPVATVEAYDTLAPGWSPVASLGTARLNLAATSGPGALYALGGSNGIGPLATHEIYDPAAGTWSPAPALPTARAGLAAVTGRDGNVYALGGYNGAFLTTVEAFDPGTGAWITGSPPKPMPTARSNLAAVTGPDGLIYAIGGQNAGGALATVEIFDPATNSWSTGPSLPGARQALAAAVGPDGLIYAIGGVDGSGIPQNTVYSYNPATAAPWAVQASLLTQQAFLAADTGPDGLIYAIGGQNFEAPVLGTVEAFTVATTATAPDPYIGNGTYQSPDIILLDTLGNPVPIGGAPGGAWDTLLQPNTNFGIQAVVYNDANIAAANTTVRFWHFPGGVGSAGALISEQTVTVPPNGSIVVTSSSPFLSAGPLQHECVAVSIANAQSLYFNVDPTTATEVIDPTVPHPAGSGHFGSAWRNTNSLVMGLGGGWRLPFRVNLPGLEPVGVKLTVAARKVAADWDRTHEIAKLRKVAEGACSDRRLPLFLIPEIRRHLPSADCELRIHVTKGDGQDVRSPGRAEYHLTANPGEHTLFTVSGRIPRDARSGDIFLLDVAAHYPAMGKRREAIVEYLEVIYVKA